MASNHNVAGLINDAAAARQRAITAVQDLSCAQASFRPSPEEWCICEVIEHLMLAEIAGVGKIWEAADALRAGERWKGENNNRGLTIDEIVSKAGISRAVAPPLVTPHIGGPLAYWLELFRGCQVALDSLGAILAEVELESVICPHPFFGPLDARQRLQLMRFHIDRHIGQIARIREAAGFPLAAPAIHSAY